MQTARIACPKVHASQRFWRFPFFKLSITGTAITLSSIFEARMDAEIIVSPHNPLSPTGKNAAIFVGKTFISPAGEADINETMLAVVDTSSGAILCEPRAVMHPASEVTWSPDESMIVADGTLVVISTAAMMPLPGHGKHSYTEFSLLGQSLAYNLSQTAGMDLLHLNTAGKTADDFLRQFQFRDHELECFVGIGDRLVVKNRGEHGSFGPSSFLILDLSNKQPICNLPHCNEVTSSMLGGRFVVGTAHAASQLLSGSHWMAKMLMNCHPMLAVWDAETGKQVWSWSACGSSCSDATYVPLVVSPCGTKLAYVMMGNATDSQPVGHQTWQICLAQW